MNTEKIQAKLKHEEGCINHMYLDTRGLVTIGVGNLLATESSATELPFIDRETHREASSVDIASEYRLVKSQRRGMVATSYAKYTHLILSEQTIDHLLEGHIYRFVRGLEQELTEFEHFPEPAQFALLDMAFNLGVAGLIGKFPSLMRAVKQREWTVCAKECHRRGIGEARNRETERLFLLASQQEH